METLRRTATYALVVIGLSWLALTAAVLLRVPVLVDATDRAGRDAIAGRLVLELTLVSVAAIGAGITLGWIGYRTRSLPEVGRTSTLESALKARAEALRRERQARDEAELASRFKDDFLATVSHELRTPLNAIVGWTHLLRGGLLSGKDRTRAIEAVDRNAASLTAIVNDLLDVSNLIQGRLKLSIGSVDLRDIARAATDTLTPAAAAKNLTMSLRLDRAEVPVSGDGQRLQQIAWHLLSNAVKYTPDGGSITLEVRKLGSRAWMRVTDSGEGIDAAALPHVFESFRQDRTGITPGLGVGLTIVQHLAELHGGAIEAKSAGQGQGATFILTLPLGHRPRERAAEAPERRVTETLDA